MLTAQQTLKYLAQPVVTNFESKSAAATFDGLT